MIEVHNIHKHFQTNHVLRDLSFDVPKGHITGLVGPNGAGKSTTIRILTGYSEADSGSVWVNGEPMSAVAEKVKRYIGYAPENAPSYREQTVQEYLNFIAKIRGIKKHQLSSEVDRALTAFSLEKVAHQAIGTLSKGYRHRTSLAQCLLGDPPVIILDEPTDGLDPIQKIETRKIITELAQSKAVLLTTHILEEVEMLCDRIVALRNGEIAFKGNTEDIKYLDATKHIVHLTVAQIKKCTLEPMIMSIPSLITADFEEHNQGVSAKLCLGTDASAEELLDQISHAIYDAGFRLTQLQREAPQLAKAFSLWSKH